MLLATQRERYRASVDQPCVERADDAAVVDAWAVKRISSVRALVVAIMPPRASSMAVDVFGEAFHHDVRAEFQRAYVVRRIEGVVHADEDVMAKPFLRLANGARHARYVGDLQGSGWLASPDDQLGVRLDGVEYVGRVGGVDDGGFDAVLLGQNLVEEPVCCGGMSCRGEDRMVAPG